MAHLPEKVGPHHSGVLEDEEVYRYMFKFIILCREVDQDDRYKLFHSFSYLADLPTRKMLCLFWVCLG